MATFRFNKINDSEYILQKKTIFGYMDCWIDFKSPFKFGEQFMYQPFITITPTNNFKLESNIPRKLKFRFQTKSFLKKINQSI